MNAIRKSLFILSSVVFASCATNSSRERIIRDMVIAGAVGAVVGYQKDSNPMANATMYAGVAASSAALLDLYLFDPDKETAKYKKESEDLRRQLDEAFSPKLETQMPGTLSGKVPDKYKSLITPGEWKIYAVDTWIEDGENRLIHQDKMMELIPPTLKPNQNPLKK